MNRLSILVATWGPPIAGALLLFAALSKWVLNDSFESVPFFSGSPIAFWAIVICAEMFVGLFLVLGSARLPLIYLGMAIFSIFSVIQLTQILSGETDCQCLGIEISSVVMLGIDLFMVAILAYAAVCLGRENRVSIVPLSKSVRFAVIISATLAGFFIPGMMSAQTTLSESIAPPSSTTIDLSESIEIGRPIAICRYFREQSDICNMQHGRVIVVRQNCESCHALIDSLTDSASDTDCIAVISKEHDVAFPGWSGPVVAFRSGLDFVARTPLVVLIRDGSVESVSNQL